MTSKIAVIETERPAAGPKPNLWLSESRLRLAFEALSLKDPECEMSLEEAEAFLGTYVDRQEALGKRDEFAEFILDARALVEAKKARARAISEQAEKLAEGVAKMEAAMVRMMQRAETDSISGETYVLALKRNPPSVEVVDASQVPLEFTRVPEDDDLHAIRVLALMIREAYGGAPITEDACDKAITLAARADARRRVVDKIKVKDHWKAHGEGRPLTPEEKAARVKAGMEPLDVAPSVPGCAKSQTTKLVVK